MAEWAILLGPGEPTFEELPEDLAVGQTVVLPMAGGGAYRIVSVGEGVRNDGYRSAEAEHVSGPSPFSEE